MENDSKDNSFYYEMPCDLTDKLTSFEKLLIVKILKPERVVEGVQRYLESELGREYSSSPISSMKELFKSANPKDPIIFVLSKGVDPTSQVESYAQSQKMRNNLDIKSLG